MANLSFIRLCIVNKIMALRGGFIVNRTHDISALIVVVVE